MPNPNRPPAGTPGRRTPKPGGPRPPARPRLGLRHKLLLSLFGLVLAALLVGGLELALRLAHYGPDLRVFKETEILGRKYYELNRDISLRYFPREMAKQPGFERFPAVKASGTYRIFSLGASSTAGDPYGPQASFSAFLREMLTDLHPDRTIEVVNCGIVAISSADVLDLLPEILRHQPDALLVYAGHNEAYGADAVLSGLRGTVESAGMMKFRIKARNTRLGILAQAVMRRLHARKGALPTGFGMENMQGKVLPHWDRLHERMLEIYRANMQELIDRATKAGVDVILCTLVSNLHDQSPMGSAHAPALKGTAAQEWEAAFNAGKSAMSAGRWDEAVKSLRKAASLDSSHAETRFRLARSLEASGRPVATNPASSARPGAPLDGSPGSSLAESTGGASDTAAGAGAARREYRAARDEDIVHFRACSDENRIVRELAQSAGSSRVLLVDLEHDLAAASPGGIPGREFLTEHVHPYTRGHAFLAERICRAMAAGPLGEKLGTWDFSRLHTTDQYMARMGLSDVDEASGLLLTLKYKLARWPFTQAYETREAAAFLQARIDSLARGFDPITAAVFSELRLGRFQDGFDYGMRHQEIARRALAAQQVPLALHEFRLCEQQWGSNAELEVNMAQATLLGNRLASTDSLLDMAARLDPKFPRIRFMRGMLRRSQGRMAEARSELSAYLTLEPTSIYANAARQVLKQMGR